ncbi:Cyclic di-GMP phosphodiesterase response regulator RpfG [Candidatus Magnetaquicoccaceae bacterium FCR-1]|uniref:Cyclic di-GMP phosphodiesterase response regulator RpfG n=1 Tax=Candidatus Magnetaquiglobus chichijimensis TaxID=3141448 RepID=A0ABQ0C853_9PROT
MSLLIPSRNAVVVQVNDTMSHAFDSSLDADRHQASILIVDDQKLNLIVLKSLLKQHGYVNVTTVEDPREVEELWSRQRFDLMLLDLEMPNLPGIEVMKILERIGRDPYLPILVITANTEETTRLEALSHGAQDFLNKPFNPSEVISRIRNMLSVRILYKRMEEKIQERTRQLHETRLEVIRCLGRAAEYRDNETGRHVIRIGQISALLARVMGLSEHHCDLIMHATPMHDVGKIGIPDHILLKPARLEAEEFEIIKTHAVIGGNILSGYREEPLVTARTIALTHHEKWDGSGYPNQISGESIPIESRICAVADVFDALTSWRPYKQPWSIDDAVQYIVRERNRHFDPRVVDAMLDNMEAIRSIKSTISD